MLIERNDANKKNTQTIVSSIPGKYFQYLSPTSLTRGSYTLTIQPETRFVDSQSKSSGIRFSLDLVYENEKMGDRETMSFF